MSAAEPAAAAAAAAAEWPISWYSEPGPAGPGTTNTFAAQLRAHAKKHGCEHLDDGADIACWDAIGAQASEVEEAQLDLYEFKFSYEEMFPASLEREFAAAARAVKSARKKDAREKRDAEFGTLLARVGSPTPGACGPGPPLAGNGRSPLDLRSAQVARAMVETGAAQRFIDASVHALPKIARMEKLKRELAQLKREIGPRCCG